jgi:DNA primase
MIPPSFIQDLLNRVDIVDIVGRYVQLKKTGANFSGLCPFHSEKSPSFTVSPTKQFYHCFGCGAHGTAIGFLIEYSGMGFVEAVKDLAQNVGMVVPDNDDRIPPAQRAEQAAKTLALSDVMQRATDFYKSKLPGSPAVDYLKRRGLTGEIAKHFALGYAPEGWDSLRGVFPEYDNVALAEAGLVIDKSDDEGNNKRRYDRFRERVMFPIRNTKGQVIAFGGRILDQGEPKYLNSPETPLFSKGHELYGLFEARTAIRDAGYVLVTEGYMDVVALAQMGFPQAVATLGTACTTTHVQKLLRQTDRVVFSFDGDKAGRRAARRALDASLPFVNDNKVIKFLFLPQEHDPDSFVREFGADAFEQAVHDAMPLSQFLINEVTGDNDLTTAEGRAHMLAEAKPLLQAMTPSALRWQIVHGLAPLVQMPPAEIESLFELSSPVAKSRQAPPRSKRAAPMGLERQIIRLLVRHPALAFDMDQESFDACKHLAPDNAEMLEQLIKFAAEMGQHANFAAMAEQLRAAGSDFDPLIAEIAADSESDFELARAEFLGALRQSKIQVLKIEQKQIADRSLSAPGDAVRYREINQILDRLRQEASAEARGNS